jgi:hypothetical protein
MQTITTFGLDIAKSVFQVHGVDAAYLPRARFRERNLWNVPHVVSRSSARAL